MMVNIIYLIRKDLIVWLGSRPLYFNWTVGQPVNWNNSENCVEMFTDGTYNDIPCTFSLKSICQLNVNAVTTTSCPDSRWVVILGKCYLYEAVTGDYDAAKSYCASNGGYVVSIATAQENEHFTNMVYSYPGGGSVWIGYHRSTGSNYYNEDGLLVFLRCLYLLRRIQLKCC